MKNKIRNLNQLKPGHTIEVKVDGCWVSIKWEGWMAPDMVLSTSASTRFTFAEKIKSRNARLKN